MKNLTLFSLIFFISFTLAQGVLNCAKCEEVIRHCQVFCSGQVVPKRIACVNKCSLNKQKCFGKCQAYNKCKSDKMNLKNDCKKLKKDGKQYVENVKKMYAAYRAELKKNRDVALKITDEQQAQINKGREYTKKFETCKRKLKASQKCIKPCISLKCIEKKKCSNSCGKVHEFCSKGCLKKTGIHKERCVKGCSTQRNNCTKACHHKKCGPGCKKKLECHTTCHTTYQKQVKTVCKKTFSPVCHLNCTKNCNKRCNKRDNISCLKSCSGSCNIACHKQSSKKCTQEHKNVLKDCKKLCKLLPNTPTKPTPKPVFDHKCGNQCVSYHKKQVELCSKKPVVCTYQCYKKCKIPSCTTPLCLEKCVVPCAKKCLWDQRKSCHFQFEKQTSNCLKSCPGWNIKESIITMKKLKENTIGKKLKCQDGCSHQMNIDKVKCLESNKSKCQSDCDGICKNSKCKTDKCRDLCNKECQTTCVSLKRKECQVLSLTKAKQCFVGCK